ncbi:MAG: 4Fe-4S binding protein [Bacteroidaceae bacterium]|nr:4Fe-4S binding protein [Bacteroidaceae bacterium]
MDVETCIKKLGYVGVLTFSTVDEEGHPQVRSISAIHYEPDAIYFFTARGKNFCRQLHADGHVQIHALTKFKEMIRLSSIARPVSDGEQEKWRDVIFSEQPYLSNVYPGDTRSIGIIFKISNAQIEYFNLGSWPIERKYFSWGMAEQEKKGYQITTECIACGTCASVCPQNAITEGDPYMINPSHCLHCGNCYEHCPADAIERIG